MDRALHRKKTGGQRAFGENLKAKVKLEKKNIGLNFQDLILRLSQFWANQNCVLQQPYDVEVGAGTMHPETFLRVLGPQPIASRSCNRAGDRLMDVTARILIAYISIRNFKWC
jgi:hypothetical protein